LVSRTGFTVCYDRALKILTFCDKMVRFQEILQSNRGLNSKPDSRGRPENIQTKCIQQQLFVGFCQFGSDLSCVNVLFHFPILRYKSFLSMRKNIVYVIVFAKYYFLTAKEIVFFVLI
jgi:hypothetical protein